MKNAACNPVLPVSVCMADGEPHVFDDRVYLFGSHDTPGGESFCLEDYEFFSAPLHDLSNWTSRGANYSAKQDPLYGENARYLYAPDVVQGNDGRYYLYYCLAGWKGEGGYSHPISVAVCDSPDGKYEYYGVVQNPDGTPYQGFVCFDPAVMNDGGVIRLYFGTGPFRGMAVKPWNALVLSRVYSGVFGKPAKAFLQKPGPLGANAAVLCDDMLTLKAPPKRIADTPDFKGHAFFESSSIRKIGDRYYFIYSSQKNHELCYATSSSPDREFRYGGTLVSNGDVGCCGRKEHERCNATGTTHGSMECIGGQWYVFYHRLTHGSDYSRQMCAEPLIVRPDGSISQAEMTSCGLNGGNLPGKGEYPAVICCNLTNGKMPHIANQVRKDIPCVTHSGGEWYVGNATKGTLAAYKYFSIQKHTKLCVTARGTGTMQVSLEDECIGTLSFRCEKWTEAALVIPKSCTHAALRLTVTEGSLDILSLRFSPEGNGKTDVLSR